jgi:hypothetical protein
LDLLDVVHETCAATVLDFCQSTSPAAGGRARALTQAAVRLLTTTASTSSPQHRRLHDDEDEDEDEDEDKYHFFHEDDMENRPETFFTFAARNVENNVLFIQAELGYGSVVDTCLTELFVAKNLPEDCYNSMLEVENLFQEIVAVSLAITVPSFIWCAMSLLTITFVLTIVGCVTLCNRKQYLQRRNLTRNVLFAVWENPALKSSVLAVLNKANDGGDAVDMGELPPLPHSVIDKHHHPEEGPKTYKHYLMLFVKVSFFLWALIEEPCITLFLVSMYYVNKRTECFSKCWRKASESTAATSTYQAFRRSSDDAFNATIVPEAQQSSSSVVEKDVEVATVV